MKRKIFAAILITLGLAALSVPLLYHFYGSHRTGKMIEQFEHSMEQESGDEATEKEAAETEAAVSAEKTTLPEGENVIGLIEIEALELKYPVLEGTESGQLSAGIGHISDTAAIGEPGNCVLAGHRGSRYGTFFKHLNRLTEGDRVKLTDKEGRVSFYEVDSWEVVGPYDNSVKAQGEKTELTLLTCESSGTMRLIYHCSYIGQEEKDEGRQ